MKKRIIPCLDIKDGRTVKGTKFLNLRDAGDPVELAQRYAMDGADELVFLDISASQEGRKTLLGLVSTIAKKINIPFTVGGGISTLVNAKEVVEAGADKVSINSSAVSQPDLISQISSELGSQAVVVAIDAKKINEEWIVFTHGGKRQTHRKLPEWAAEVEKLGAGEILLTSMDCDGTKEGFDLQMYFEIGQKVNIPVIASGGAGNKEHFKALFEQCTIGAALAAGIFHFGQLSIPELKTYLTELNIAIR